MKTAQMSINRRMDEQTVVYSYMEFYSAIKRHKPLLHLKTRVDLKNNMLKEKRSPQKSAYCIIAFI